MAICISGTCGMVLRSPGTTGMSLQDDLFQSLECRLRSVSGDRVHKISSLAA
jgi:hypothetical protein